MTTTDSNPPPRISEEWSKLFAAAGESLWKTALPEWLLRQRWFGAKARTISSLRVLASVPIPAAADLDLGQIRDQPPGPPPPPPSLFFFEVTFDRGPSGVYQVPLAFSTSPAADQVRTAHSDAIIATFDTIAGNGVLYDASIRDDVRQALLLLIGRNVTVEPPSLHSAVLTGKASTAYDSFRGSGNLSSSIGQAEQSNTSILYEKLLILKLFRRLEPGENPDVEIGRFLTEVAHFPRIPPFLGEINLALDGGEKTTLAMLQGLVPSQGDGWKWFQSQLAALFGAIGASPAPATKQPTGFFDQPEFPLELLQYSSASLRAAALLGKRTAEMHLALATPTLDPAFCAEPLTMEDTGRDALRIRKQIDSAMDALAGKLNSLPPETARQAALLLARRSELDNRARDLASGVAGGKRIRIHGDYHLGQTLRVAASHAGDALAPTDPDGDFVLLDFEGEPARPLAERRRKESPLRDVAGMVRSFSYAAQSALAEFLSAQKTASAINLRSWADLWESAACGEFLRAFRTTASADPALLPPPAQAQTLLAAYVLEKALYELLYELNNRPAWLHIPLAGILNL